MYKNYIYHTNVNYNYDNSQTYNIMNDHLNNDNNFRFKHKTLSFKEYTRRVVIKGVD